MFEKLLLAAIITFSMSLSIGTSRTTSLPSVAVEAQAAPAQSADLGKASIVSVVKPDRLKIYLA